MTREEKIRKSGGAGMMEQMTNYQKVRIMNKAGFAEWLSEFIICPLCPAYAGCWVSELDPDRDACAEQLEAWLDQEAAE